MKGGLILAMLLAAAPAWALDPGEALSDPGLEARARALSRDLRCPVCQSQSIDESDAPLARDLRHLVRERLQAGDDDQAVLRFVTDRYGNFVRLRPPLRADTAILWLGPFAVLAIGGAALALRLRRRSRGRRSS
jgi:cytochrome c-type biogenesis protein CcmH